AAAIFRPLLGELLGQRLRRPFHTTDKNTSESGPHPEQPLEEAAVVIVHPRPQANVSDPLSPIDGERSSKPRRRPWQAANGLLADHLHYSLKGHVHCSATEELFLGHFNEQSERGWLLWREMGQIDRATDLQAPAFKQMPNRILPIVVLKPPP